MPAEAESNLRPRHQRRELGELTAGVRQAVRQDGDGLALAVDLDVESGVVGDELWHYAEAATAEPYAAIRSRFWCCHRVTWRTITMAASAPITITASSAIR